MYKFMVHTLLKNNFTLLSAQTITAIGCKIITHNKQFFKDHKVGALKLESFFLSNQRQIKSHGENNCVLGYVWDQCRGRKGFKTYTYDKSKEEMMEYAADFPLISTQELINWARACHSNVSFHAFDATYRKFMKYTDPQRNISLVYFVQDHHCHAITDEGLKMIATKANRGGTDNLWKYMSDLKWTRRHDQMTLLNSLEEDEELDKENHIIMLPEDTKMEHAKELCIGRTNYFVEYLHWDNRGVLDGFLDHRNNMYVPYNEYNTRKSICDTLYEKYKTREFMWSNQSYTP